jgi:hypothetical protein
MIEHFTLFLLKKPARNELALKDEEKGVDKEGPIILRVL